MKIGSTAEMSYRAIIACIKTENNNSKKGNFQEEQAEILECNGIKRIVI